MSRQRSRVEEAPPGRRPRNVHAQTKVEDEVSRILADLLDPSRSPAAIRRRNEAIIDSSKHPDKRISAALIEMAMRDPDHEMRASAVAALGDRGGKAVLDCLTDRLAHDSDPQVRWHSCLALQGYFKYQKDGKARSGAIFTALIGALGSDKTARNRDFLAKTIGEMALEIPLRTSPLLKNRIVAALSLATKDPDKDVRMSAVWALGEIGRPRTAPGGGLAPSVRDACSVFDPMLVMPALALAASQDPDKDLRRMAKEELDRVGEWKKTMALRKASGKP